MFFPRRLIGLSIVLALFCSSQIVIGEEKRDELDSDLDDYYSDEDFVTLATGTKTLLHKAPSVASVITKEKIKKMGLNDLDEILETIPGFHVSRNKAGNEPVFIIRGVTTRYNPQVLMLINGIPVTSVYVGNRGQVWGGMPVASIERVEVIRGPGSALYGADAFSGVINVITKGPDNINLTEFGGLIGSFDSKNFWFSSSNKISDDINTFFGYQYYETNGHEEVVDADVQTFLDLIFGTNASYAPGPMSNMRETHELRAQVDYKNWIFRAGMQQRTRGLGLGITGALTPTSRSSSDRINFDINYDNKSFTDNGELSAQISYFDTTLEIDGNLILFPPGADIGLGGVFPDGVIGNPEVFERHQRANITYTYKGVTDHSIRMGLGYIYSDIYKVQESKNFALGPNGEFLVPGSPVVDVSDTPFAFLPEKDRTDNYFYVQDVWQVANDWALTAGIRHDDYSDFGATTNPRFAVVWSTSLNLTSKLLYGQAFRAPSMANLYAINNPAALGSPDVQPEEMATTELVFDYHPSGNITGIFSIFSYVWKDVIQFSPDEGLTTTTAKNIGQRSGQGFELEMNWKATDDFNMSANYSYQNSQDDETGMDLIDVPKQQLFIMANYKVNSNWNINTQFHRVMDRVRAESDSREYIDDNVWLDLSARWKRYDSKLEVAITGKNLLNADLREPTQSNIPNDIPLAGMSVYAEIRYVY
jgi:iron complex outermembrane receptor protein